MMQLFGDIPATLVLLSCAVVGWILNKWTNKYFAALVSARDRETAKLRKIDESPYISFPSHDEQVAELTFSQVTEVKSIPKESKKTQAQRHAEARRRLRRQAKAVQVDTEQDTYKEAEIVQGEEASVVPLTVPAASLKTFDADSVAFAKNGLAVTVEAFDIMEESVDTCVQGKETLDITTGVAFMVGKRYNKEGETAAIEVHGAPLVQQVEDQLADDAEFVQIDASFEDVDKHEASIPSGSSTHGDSNSGTLSEDDCSTNRTCTLDDLNLAASESVDMIQPPCLYTERADSRFPADGDGWMMSFEEQHIQLQSDVRLGSDFTSPENSVDEAKHRCVEPTPVTIIHRDHTFKIDGRVFAPFSDEQGRMLYTDGELVYAAASVRPDAGFDLPALEILSTKSFQGSVADALEPRFLLDPVYSTSKQVSNIDSDSEGKEDWAACWDFESGGAW